MQGRPGAAGEGVRLNAVRAAAARIGSYLIALLISGANAGCVGVFAADSSSASIGTHGSGALYRGVAIPAAGPGYVVLPALLPRAARTGTGELVTLLRHAFAEVERIHPESLATLGDLSLRGGGEAPAHGSHESGRDVDIFFYGTTVDGRPYRPARAGLRYGPSGWARAWAPLRGVPFTPAPVPPVRFDAVRTWALVHALLTDGSAEVQWIFIHRALGELLLIEARSSGTDPEVVAKAEGVFKQPGDAEPHDDHMHVRIFCDPGDRELGCLDKGPQRWWKKRWKWMPPGESEPVSDEPLVAAD